SLRSDTTRVTATRWTRGVRFAVPRAVAGSLGRESGAATGGAGAGSFRLTAGDRTTGAGAAWVIRRSCMYSPAAMSIRPAPRQAAIAGTFRGRTAGRPIVLSAAR